VQTKGGFFMGEWRIRLGQATVDDVATAMLVALNSMEGDAPSGWAWSEFAGDPRGAGSTTMLLGLEGRLWVAHRYCDEAGTTRFTLALLASRVGQPRPVAARLVCERTGVPAGVLLAWRTHAADVQSLAAGLLGHLAERWPEVRRVQAEAAPVRGNGAGGPDPCAVIPEGWQREAVCLWRRGYSAPEIGQRLGYGAKTVGNRLSELRQAHGEEIVPTDAQRRRLKN
jgi:hypothetical protein